MIEIGDIVQHNNTSFTGTVEQLRDPSQVYVRFLDGSAGWYASQSVTLNYPYIKEPPVKKHRIGVK